MEYFGKAGLNGQTAKLTTVKQVREIGSAVLTCEDLSNWATDTPVFFATYKVDIDTQKIVPNSQINWRGKVNVENNTIIEIQADSDTPDKGNAIGDIVECLPTAGWANSLVDGISVIHKQDGTLKANVVKGDNIDFESFKDGSIEPRKLKKVADPSNRVINLGGLSIVYGSATFPTANFSQDYWGFGFRSNREEEFIIFQKPFKRPPTVMMSVRSNNIPLNINILSSPTETRTPAFTIYTHYRDNIAYTIDYIAIGETD